MIPTSSGFAYVIILMASSPSATGVRRFKGQNQSNQAETAKHIMPAGCGIITSAKEFESLVCPFVSAGLLKSYQAEFNFHFYLQHPAPHRTTSSTVTNSACINYINTDDEQYTLYVWLKLVWDVLWDGSTWFKQFVTTRKTVIQSVIKNLKNKEQNNMHSSSYRGYNVHFIVCCVIGHIAVHK